MFVFAKIKDKSPPLQLCEEAYVFSDEAGAAKWLVDQLLNDDLIEADSSGLYWKYDFTLWHVSDAASLAKAFCKANKHVWMSADDMRPTQSCLLWHACVSRSQAGAIFMEWRAITNSPYRDNSATYCEWVVKVLDTGLFGVSIETPSQVHSLAVAFSSLAEAKQCCVDIDNGSHQYLGKWTVHEKPRT